MVSPRDVAKGITSLLTLTQRIEADVKDMRADVKVLSGKVENLEKLIEATNRRVDDLDEKLTSRIADLDGKLNTRIDDLDAKLTTRIDGLDGKLSTRIDDLKQSFGQVKEIETLKAEVRELKAKIR